MTNNKKYTMLLCSLGLILLLIGVTYAFFNYTRTGLANNIRVGRISFESKNEETISLSNAFPIDPTEEGIMDDSTKVGAYSVDIKGDTDYSEGIEYLVSSTDTHISVPSGSKSIDVPLSLNITVEDLGTSSPNYFTARENTNESIYKQLVGDTLVGDQMLLVGYIAPNSTPGDADGVDGSITIKAYLDENKILISDTYDGTESGSMGTLNSLAEGKTVLTTTEWSSIKTSPISFKVKVEANEGIWVTGSLEEIMNKDNIGIDTDHGVDFSKTSNQDHTLGVYTRAGTQNISGSYPILYYRGAVENNNVVFNNKCWKTVRTTDTGGVKLLYNGEAVSGYDAISPLARDDYANVANPYNSFTFDSTDNSWNVTMTNPKNSYIAFTVPAGSNYSLVTSITTSANSGGGYYFYKNNWQTLYANGVGGGQSANYTYTYGTLTANDVVKFMFMGSADADNPVTIKLTMQQNSQPLSQSNYNVLPSGSFTFDETNSKWSIDIESQKREIIEFNVTEAGDYQLNLHNDSLVLFYFYVNGIPTYSNTGSKIIDLPNLSSGSSITIEYLNYISGSSTTVEFYLSKAQFTDTKKCRSTNNDTLIDLGLSSRYTRYSTNISSPAFVGYIRGTDYQYSTSNWTTGALFGSSFTWDGTHYKLSGTTVSTPDDTHHYSCNSTDANDTCTSIRFVYWYKDSSNIYYISIPNGNGIEEAFDIMFSNNQNSEIKNYIDNWYESSMTSVTNKLEDTVWCNDRSIARYNGWTADGTINGSSSYYKNYALLFSADERSSYATGSSPTRNQPSLVCQNKKDRFTVKSTVGNQALTYPVALLTEDEIVLAGGRGDTVTDSYIVGGDSYWLMSPANFTSNSARMFLINGNSLDASVASGTAGVRPAISIKPGQLIKSGVGTIENPYIID